MTAKLLIAASALACVCAPAALAQDNPLDRILNCSRIANDAERLACFDTQAGALSGEVERGEVVAVDREAIEAVERDTFGFSMPSLPRFSLPSLGGRSAGAPDAPSPSSRGISTAETAADTRIVERTGDGQVDRVEMTIQEVATIGYSTRRFIMTNGQVWDQTDTDRVNVPRARGGEQLTAEIRRAGAGGFFLRINGQGRAVRVARTR